MPGSMRVAIFLILGAVVGPAATAQDWVDLTPAAGNAPAPRRNSASIYDPVGHRMIVFGGKTSSGDVNDVWAFDLADDTWTELTPAVGPAPAGRFTANAVYDSLNHSMIVWSGQGTGAFLNDVWSFDLANPGWSEYMPAAPMPNIRYGTAAVFDPATRELVTFAGFTDMGRFDDTWRFDGDDVQWTDVSPASGPSQRCLHSASYDGLTHRMIIYGGQQTGALDDIWAFDLANDTWADLTPATRPDGRFFTAQAYDAIRHRALVFGGNLSPGRSDEVWAFDLAAETWSEVQPSGSGPLARDASTGIYVLTEDRMIVFGGNTGAFRNDVWAVDFAPGGGIVFPWQIVADGDALRWPMATNVDYVRGDLAEVEIYGVDVLGSETHVTSIEDAAVPTPGNGFYYVVRLNGDRGSWQTNPGDNPERDTDLP
ncbi:MAG: kelch repeat-containing protein [Acidobacteriota bacterium]|nr:kelch repeat-containing protein [Acidobacteriota bacterium]